MLCLLVLKNLQKLSESLLRCKKALLNSLRIKHVGLCRVVFVSSQSFILFKSGDCFRIVSDVMIPEGKSLGNENFI